MKLNRAARAIVGAGVLAATVLGGSQAANAVAPSPAGTDSTQACAPDGAQNGYYWNVNPVYKFVGSGQRSYGDPGGTINVSVGKTATVSGSITGTTSVDAGVVFVKASASVGVTIGASSSVTVTSGYSWPVPASHAPGAYVEIGSAGYRIDWQKGTYASPCTYVVKGSGVITGVTKNIAFSHN